MFFFCSKTIKIIKIDVNVRQWGQNSPTTIYFQNSNDDIDNIYRWTELNTHKYRLPTNIDFLCVSAMRQCDEDEDEDLFRLGQWPWTANWRDNNNNNIHIHLHLQLQLHLYISVFISFSLSLSLISRHLFSFASRVCIKFCYIFIYLDLAFITFYLFIPHLL